MPNFSTLISRGKRYFVVGLASLSADFISTMVVTYLFVGGAVSPAPRLIGFATGGLLSYFLNRKFTFVVQQKPWQATRFVLVLVVTGALASLVYDWFGSNFGASAPYYGWLASTGFSVPFQFMLFQFWVFRDEA